MSGPLSSIYYPSLVPSSEDRLDVIKKTYAIKGEKREIFFSNELTQLIYNLSIRHHLSDEQTAELSRTIRKWFFDEITNQECAKRITTIIKGDIHDGAKILRQIQRLEVADTSSSDAEMPAHHTSLPLAQARETYPHIDKQHVTTDPIVIKPGQLPGTQPFAGPLAPTVKNWLDIYTQSKGVAKQTALARADFIYHAPFTRGLKDTDRTKLAQLLRARDENTPVIVDTDTGTLYWDLRTTHLPSRPTKTPSAQNSPTPPQQKPSPQHATPTPNQHTPTTPDKQSPIVQTAMGKRQKKSFRTTQKPPTATRHHIQPITRGTPLSKTPRSSETTAHTPPTSTQKSPTPHHLTPQPNHKTPLVHDKQPRTPHTPQQDHTITSLKNLRGQKPSTTTPSPQAFSAKPRAVAPSPDTKLPTPQSRTIPSQKKQRARQKIDQLVRADLPYQKQTPQRPPTRPTTQPVSPRQTPRKQPPATVSFSSGQTLPAEKPTKTKRAYHIAPIKRGL